MRVDLLESAMDADVAAGRKPLFVSANGGATNSGAVDPLAELAELCDEQRRLAPRRRGVRRLRGPRRARAPAARRDRARGLDHARPAQVALPAVRVRLPARPRRRRAPERVPDHARLPAEAAALDSEVNFSDLGLQLSRMARAFKVWCLDPVLRARRVPARDRADVRPRRARASGGSRPATGSSSRRGRRLGIVSFRRRFDEDEDLLNARLVADARGERARARLVDAAQGPVHDPHVRHEPHERRGGRRPRARLPRAGRRRRRADRRGERVRAASGRDAERDPAARDGRACALHAPRIALGRGGRLGRRSRRAAARSTPARR